MDKASQWGGYCWHGSQLFPTWHRPYMMLIEQVRMHNLLLHSDLLLAGSLVSMMLVMLLEQSSTDHL
jgi:hypothetical protein